MKKRLWVLFSFSSPHPLLGEGSYLETCALLPACLSQPVQHRGQQISWFSCAFSPAAPAPRPQWADGGAAHFCSSGKQNR